MTRKAGIGRVLYERTTDRPLLRRAVFFSNAAFYSARGLVFDPTHDGPRFLIFGEGRSGSTLLTQLLDQHPKIACDGELFGFDYATPMLFIRGRAVCYCRKVGCWGFKAKAHQVEQQFGDGSIVWYLNKMHQERWRIIHLVRRNSLARALSVCVARNSLLWNAKTTASAPNEKYHLDPAEIINHARAHDNLIQAHERYLEDIPHMTVEYERDLLDNTRHQLTSDQIFQFLGLANYPIKCETQHLAARGMASYVKNSDDVITAIRESPYSHLLEDIPI